MRIDLTKPNATFIEQWPWPIRGLLGCLTAVLAVGVTYGVPQLRGFPFLFAFPTVVLSAWFFGVLGGAICGVVETVLIDVFLTKPQFQFTVVSVREEVRLVVFLALSVVLGWAIRRLAEQRSQLITHELQQELALAQAERELAQERAKASEALRDREDLLQIALRSNDMALWVWDRQQDIVLWSDEIYRIVGRESGSVKPSTVAWLSFVHPEDLEDVRAAVMRTRQGEEYHQQHRVVWPNGTVRWVESRGKTQRDGGGNVTRVVGGLADITTRKLSEEAMLRAEKLAVAGRLAASVAHEINNPLEAVANLLYLIEHADTVEAAGALAKQGLDELMRVSMITQQTLKFHRQAGTPKDIMLSELIQTVLTLFRGRLRTSRIKVEVRSKNEVSISCMPGEMQQIAANLISNAIDAMLQGGNLIIRLRQSCDWRDRKTPGMRVTFLDSGVGMDRATMHQIFEPFFTTKTDTGTGLGLWVVAQLVERHHGSVRVWSTRRPEGSATAISLFMPLNDPGS
jgi:PAS domain S-box-containing protein